MKRIELCALLALLVVSKSSLAIAPPYISDAALARYPIIVVAKWDKPPFTAHHRYAETNVVTAIESFTDLNVLRVIKGNLKPGVHRFMRGWGIAWARDGSWVNSGTSTEMPGDVNSVAEPNIWFLQMELSWDPTDKAEHLSVSNYREIQPLVLENYFGAMASAHPEKEVPKLLTSTNAVVVRRALQYVCGDIWPWPANSGWESKYLRRKQGKPLTEQSSAVAAVIERNELKELRALATSVYAELKGANCVRYVRRLLADPEPDVRAMSVGVLARYKDSGAIDGINRAVTGMEKGWMACKIIEAISGWGDLRLVPTLIAFLESGDLAYRYGDDLGIPALKAREALHRMTGHWFPYEVQASLRAWKEAGGISNFGKRQQRLAQILPSDANPFRAEVVGDGGTNVACKITNNSKQDVAITRVPAWSEQRWPAGSAGAQVGSAKPNRKEDFVLLKPGESTRFEITLYGRFLLAEPASRQLKLTYTQTGSAWGMNAWVGSLTAEFGAAWTGQRKIESIEETWPNGNLKAKGRTINGEKSGEWNHFNEEGDRVKIIYYNEGRGSATCNPEHPDNKGAGKRVIR